MSEFCVFCYKATEAKVTDSSGKDFDSTVENNALSKFSKVLDRFGNDAKENGFSDLSNLDKLNRSKWLSCCEPCRNTIDAFCEDFHKLKCLEIAMEWKLQRLKDSMEYAGRVPSRWFKLQQFFKIQNFIEASSGTNDDILEHLKSYREHILKKCTQRLSKSQPRVHLKRIDYSELSLIETVSDEADSKIQHSPHSSPRKLVRNIKVEDDEVIAENCLLFEEDNQYMTIRKLKQDPDSDKDWTDDNHSLSDDEDNFSAEDDDKLSNDNTNSSLEDDDNFSPDDKDEDSFKCKQCKKTFLTAQRLKDHQRKIHVKPKHKCCICQKVFKIGQALRKHQLTHKDPITWEHKCCVCGRTFPTKQGMLKHIESHKAVKPDMNGTAILCQSIQPPVPCPECKKMFANEARMKEHLKRFHAPAKIKCSKCPRKFKIQDDLKKHEVRAHTDPSKWNFKCPTCGKPFMYNSMLMSHVYRNHRDPQTWDYKCEICEKPFFLKSTMLQHMTTHQGRADIASPNGSINNSLLKQAPVTCKKCDKKFANKDRLNDHLRRFHVPRTHKCSKCNQKFRTKDNLSKHQVYIHTDPKTWKFQCSLCDMRFVYNSLLQAHRKTSHKEGNTRCIKKEN